MLASPRQSDLTVAPRMMAGPTPGWAGFASAGLDATLEASGPHDFAVRSNPSSPGGFAGARPVFASRLRRARPEFARRLRRARRRTSARRWIAHGVPCEPALPSRFTPDAAASTASRPASLTIRIRPSVGQDGGGYAGDLGRRETRIFFPMELDSPNHTKSGPSGALLIELPAVVTQAWLLAKPTLGPATTPEPSFMGRV